MFVFLVEADFRAVNISCRFVFRFSSEVQDCCPLLLDEIKNFCASETSLIHFIRSHDNISCYLLCMVARITNKP